MGKHQYCQDAEREKLEKSKASHSWIFGRQLFTEDVTLSKLSSLLRSPGEVMTTTLSEEFDLETYMQAHNSKVIPLYLLDTDRKFVFFTTDHELKPKKGWKITSLVYEKRKLSEVVCSLKNCTAHSIAIHRLKT